MTAATMHTISVPRSALSRNWSSIKPPILMTATKGAMPAAIASPALVTVSRSHRDHTSTALRDAYDVDDNSTMRHSASLRPVEDYTNKYKGEQVEVALFGGDYQEGVLTAYCSIEDVPHVELNGHILIPLQNVASLHCSSRCDAPEPDWPPRGLTEDDTGET